MMQFIKLFVFCFFLGFCLVLLFKAITEKRRRKSSQQAEFNRQFRQQLEPAGECDHKLFNVSGSCIYCGKPRTEHVCRDFRQVTEFARQCKECKRVVTSDDAPEGIPAYLALMTSPHGRLHPTEAAGDYPNLDPRGKVFNECPSCGKAIPGVHDLPQRPFGEKQDPICPYCEFKLLVH